MALSRKRANEYAMALLEAPRRAIPVTLRQTAMGIVLLHGRRRVLTRCYLNRKGMRSAALMAQALGLPLPPLGQSVSTSVSSGVLLRAVHLSALDPRREELHPLIVRLLEEAEAQRRVLGEESA